MSLVAVFIASLLGSLHCGFMCGGFAAAACCGRSGSSHVLYHAGRFITYATLGVAAGIIGQTLSAAGSLIDVQHLAALVLGAVLVLTGSAALAAPRVRAIAALQHRLNAPIISLYATMVQRLGGGSGGRALTIGLLSALLPCGWLWSFAAVAGTTENPIQGALIMAVFWAGTVPLLSGIGALSAEVGRRFGRLAPTTAALLIIIAGLWSISLHLAHNHHSMNSAQPAAGHHHHHHHHH